MNSLRGRGETHVTGRVFGFQSDAARELEPVARLSGSAMG